MTFKDKVKQLEYQKYWMRERRSEYFKDKVCSFCGSKEKLELHHVDPSTKESHRIWSWKKERRDAEIEKCIILCKSCHNNYHHKLITKPLVHGTMNGYKEKGCRCVLCKRANADKSARNKKIREEKKLSINK